MAPAPVRSLRTLTFLAYSLRIYIHNPAQDFTLFCRLIHHACLICGFCPQAREFASSFLQTLPHDNALALG